jgi:hypothetical protein
MAAVVEDANRIGTTYLRAQTLAEPVPIAHRPTRGLIEVPDTPLTDLRASMVLPPAAMGPTEP